jgi:hypothetical protein
MVSSCIFAAENSDIIIMTTFSREDDEAVLNLRDYSWSFTSLRVFRVLKTTERGQMKDARKLFTCSADDFLCNLLQTSCP